MTLVMFNNISENSCTGRQDVMYNFELENSEPDIFGNFKRNKKDSIYSFPIKVGWQYSLFCSSKYKFQAD